MEKTRELQYKIVEKKNGDIIRRFYSEKRCLEYWNNHYDGNVGSLNVDIQTMDGLRCTINPYGDGIECVESHNWY